MDATYIILMFHLCHNALYPVLTNLTVSDFYKHWSGSVTLRSNQIYQILHIKSQNIYANYYIFYDTLYKIS